MDTGTAWNSCLPDSTEPTMNALQTAPASVYSRGMARTLIDRIDEVLAARSWSEREWTDRAHASHGTVSALRRRLGENPRATMNTHTLRALAEAAGVSETWLRTGHGTRDLATGVPESRPYVVQPPTPSVVADGTTVRVRLEPGVAPRFTFGSLERWQGLEHEARRLRPLHPAWVWARVAETPLFLVREIDGTTVAVLADFLRWAEEGLHAEAPATTADAARDEKKRVES
jgi:AraC-like DNA-binding protein